MALSTTALSASSLALLESHGLHTADVALEDGTRLILLTDVRLVPARRLVCEASWQGQAVFAKLFFGQRAKAYAQRDQQGVLALQAADILAPNILAFTRVAASDVYVLIFEAIMPSQHAEAMYAQASSAERQQLIKQLVIIVAKQHQACLVQTDMYLKNFLVQSSASLNKIYSIDGDGIRKHVSLGRQTALKNLSMLLSKVDVLELAQFLPSWLEVYANARGWSAPPAMDTMQVLIQQARRQAVTRYADHKVFRQCTDVSVKQGAQQYLAVAQAFSSLFADLQATTLDDWMQHAELLKDGNTCTVSLTTIAAQPMVIKRYNIKNLGHSFSRMWRPSRAAVSWANAHRLQLLGLPTPQPIALLETRTMGLRGKAYFLNEYIQAPDLAESFNAIQDKVERAALVKAVVQLCYRLYLLQISHGDFKASNIKVVAGEPMLIDLDSMQQHRWNFFAKRAHARDLQRLMQNWKHDTSLYNAFIKSFKVVYADHTPLQQANILSD